ncbi:MAG: T9SS type A sorting domain-containing protein [bacterium]
MIITILVSVLIGYVYEDADSLIVIDDSLVICGTHQYNIKVHITNKGILKVTQWSGAADSTGWLLLIAPLILIQDSSSINGSKTGYRGGNNTHPDGYGPGYGEAGGMSGGAGGGAGYGGNGGNGGDLYPGAGGSVYGDPQDTLIDIGSGGGAGRYLYVDGFGGSGGAMTHLKAQKIIIDTSDIETNGQRGYDGSLEAGGGGSGGGIMLWADSIVIHSSALSVNGGDGGNTYGFGGGGGAGGGRIKIFYSSQLDTSNLILSAQGGAAGIMGDTLLPQSDSGMPGSIHIELITGITEIANKVTKNFFIYPNPVKDIAKITCANTPLKLHLYDISGRIVKTIWLKNNTEFVRLNDLEQGIYFLKSNEENKPAHKIILLK